MIDGGRSFVGVSPSQVEQAFPGLDDRTTLTVADSAILNDTGKSGIPVVAAGIKNVTAKENSAVSLN